MNHVEGDLILDATEENRAYNYTSEIQSGVSNVEWKEKKRIAPVPRFLTSVTIVLMLW